ncbi:MAG TPA: SDR family NAD(P)-dependent oxidoreductase [Mycobacteriales bacterium]|nr:SDR family NAD(P)-dependent oxidoreductase [Mycobacteriales bacterium]
MQLRDSVVIVTGASAGIGRATAEELHRRGARLVLVARTRARLTELTERLDATPVVEDVQDPAHAERVVAAALQAHGRVDAVVANAGIGHAGAFAAMPPERIDELLAVNVRAPMLLARAALPHLLEQRRGAIVVVSSIAGALLVPHETVYSATKAAVEGFVEPLREELRGSGVTVCSVLPGVVATEFFARRGAPYDRGFPGPIPPGRVAVAIANAVERGTPRVVVPRWLGLPIRLRGLAPGVYRMLSRRLG